MHQFDSALIYDWRRGVLWGYPFEWVFTRAAENPRDWRRPIGQKFSARPYSFHRARITATVTLEILGQKALARLWDRAAKQVHTDTKGPQNAGRR